MLLLADAAKEDRATTSGAGQLADIEHCSQFKPAVAVLVRCGGMDSYPKTTADIDMAEVAARDPGNTDGPSRNASDG